jgi:hypothetical protein
MSMPQPCTMQVRNCERRMSNDWPIAMLLWLLIKPDWAINKRNMPWNGHDLPNRWLPKSKSLSNVPPNTRRRRTASHRFLHLWHTTKHQHWKKSLDLPNAHMHSFAQGVLDQMVQKDPRHPKKLKEFTTEHICQTFPSWKDVAKSRVVNSDPLSRWALGCQLVSMNYSTFDAHVVKADGRFRQNGSCGYVLKPESLINYDTLPECPDSWTINVLCGSCLPAPELKRSRKMNYINPFVKITLYGGDVEQKSAEH